jgi:hypothetical protein
MTTREMYTDGEIAGAIDVSKIEFVIWEAVSKTFIDREMRGRL